MAVALALLASCCYGLSNYVGPTLSRDLPVYAVLIAGQFVAFTVSGIVVLLVGTGIPEADQVAAAGVAGLGNAYGLVAFYRAAQLGPLSIVTPIGSLGAIVPVAVGLSSGEPLGVLKAAGILLALGGVIVATRGRNPAPIEGHDARAAAAWALSSAVGFGLFLTFMAPAAEGGVFWAVLLSRTTLLVFLVSAAILLASTQLPPLRRLPSVAVPGVLLFAGTMAYSAATREGDLSVVSVAGSLFPIVTIGLAFALGGERLSRIQGLGVAGAIVGVVLVSARG